MSTKKTKGLGMGLTALLGPDANQATSPLAQQGPSTTDQAEGAGAKLGGMSHLRLEQLQAGKYQPRTRMDEEALQELAASIRQHGIMQPIVVRAMGQGSQPKHYEIIAGERRYRAARLAGLNEVPVIVRELADQDALALALIENIQREDLSPLEQARAIKRLLDEFNYTHEQAADILGRSRSATSNLLRLLQLALPVQTMLQAGDIDMGHARALLSLAPADQIMLGHEIHAKRLSVREAEKLVQERLKNLNHGGSSNAKKKKVRADADIQRLAEKIADALAMPVSLKPRGREGGDMTISFKNHEALEQLLERLQLNDLLEN
jgi:ParB family transcriptional regulator, chromosome partitioning protein